MQVSGRGLDWAWPYSLGCRSSGRHPDEARSRKGTALGELRGG